MATYLVKVDGTIIGRALTESEITKLSKEALLELVIGTWYSDETIIGPQALVNDRTGEYITYIQSEYGSAKWTLMELDTQGSKSTPYSKRYLRALIKESRCETLDKQEAEELRNNKGCD
jgi:hypothetical protein